MGKLLDFSGPYLKTERAKHHINELEAIFKRYVATNRKSLTPKYNRKPRGTPIGTKFPKHTPTVLGDALHNLRAALDHAYCELVLANGHAVHERSFFPIVNANGKDTWQSRKASMEGHETAGCGPGRHIIDCLSNEVQPYMGGNGEELVRLHELDIADKHMILLPTEHRTVVESMKIAGGTTLTNFTASGNFQNNISFGPGTGLDPNHKHKVTFTICFGRGQPYEGQPILPILEDLAVRVNDTLRLLETRAKETP